MDNLPMQSAITSSERSLAEKCPPWVSKYLALSLKHGQGPIIVSSNHRCSRFALPLTQAGQLFAYRGVAFGFMVTPIAFSARYSENVMAMRERCLIGDFKVV
jgi:hypothetical protein